jgi:hypothetical protein
VCACVGWFLSIYYKETIAAGGVEVVAVSVLYLLLLLQPLAQYSDGAWDYGAWDYVTWDYGAWDYGAWDYGAWAH